MKQISIQDLKARLSAAVAEAEAGETILVTRHKEAVAQLGPAGRAQVRLPTRPGARLQPAIRSGTKGRYLAALLEDRGTR